MSTAAELAKSSRLILADALSALQSDDVPDSLLTVAEHIAQAMGILHAIERSGGTVLDGRDKALGNVRNALDALQAVGVDHPAVDKATEAVASSLSKMFALSRCSASPAAVPGAAKGTTAPVGTAGAAPARPGTGEGRTATTSAVPRRPALDMTSLAGTPARVAASPATGAAPAAADAPANRPSPPSPMAALPIVDVGPAPTTMVVETTPLAATPRPPKTAGGPTPGPSAAAPTAAAAPPRLDPTGTSPQAAAAMAAGAPAQASAEVEAARRALAEAEARAAEEARRAAEARRIAEEKAAEAARIAAEAERQAAAQASQEAKVLKPVPGQEQARRPADGTAPIVVELAVHSPSNFYKGLAGNDVVDHGGVFVATYKIPKRGTAVALRVLLPGELEFDAEAVVQWTRETRSGDEQPGFGAQFTRISAEGRGLVARYARKREPMFYDDL